MTPEQRERYLRHVLLKEVGGQGQQKLLAARALVVGAGGIGAPLIQYLAAAGVGTVGIADDDAVALSNLQRQVIYGTGDIGAAKTARARAAVARLNPDVTVVEHPVRLDDANARAVVAGYDVIVEGVDNFEGRYVLNRACIAARKPLVSAAVGRFEGQLALFKPWAEPGLPCYRCFAPEAPPRDEQINCAEEGVLGPVAGVMGALAAMEVLKEILGIGETLAGRLLIYRGLETATRTVKLPADPECPDCGGIRRG
ncbi:HesA/MoeB/ThiF family protein [Amphiplicatus metriothermophilus]|nr:molybdopterin-synthase adenylyltransferase MoeB [Amphiplicatus metriothermophilus]MBB5517542.1 adenylyltransferase/sulfurtransferase [Amphiplicatus metriothermophilus]